MSQPLPDNKGTDETSIKPVSSLRSRFENLGLDASPSIKSPLSPGAATPQNFGDRGHSTQERPSRSTLGSAAGLGISSEGLESAKVSNGAKRPVSISQLPIRHISPPQVTVNSPKSPPKDIPVARGMTPSPSRPPRHSPSPSRSIPNVSPKTSLPTMPPLPPRQRSSEHVLSSERLSAPDTTPKAHKTPKIGNGAPPPINRAGKPCISLASSGPSAIGEGFSPSRDKAVSPFSTPPSSGENTPRWQLSPTDTLSSSLSRAIASSAKTQYMPLAPPDMPAQPRSQPSLSMLSSSRKISTPLDVVLDHPQSLDPPDERHSRSGLMQPPSISNRSSPSRTPRIPPRPSIDDQSFRSRNNSTQELESVGLSIDMSTRSRLSPEVAPPKPLPPAVPAPRRSMDTRRSVDMRRSMETEAFENRSVSGSSRMNARGGLPLISSPDGTTEYPDASNANRRPPKYEQRPWEIGTGYNTRLFSVCGGYVCTSGFITRIWNANTGQSITSIEHGEGVKVTSMAWKPMLVPDQEGERLLLGTNMGEMLEIDTPSGQIVHSRSVARGEIAKIFRHSNDMWSIDSDGLMSNWRLDLAASPSTYRIGQGHSASVVVDTQLWLASGKDIRILDLLAPSEQHMSILRRPLSQQEAGDITCATTLDSQVNAVYFGHADGKVSVYDKRDYSLVGVFNVGLYKISSLAGVGTYLWAGYSTGSVMVYDTSTTPWIVKKDWPAHHESVCGIVVDQPSAGITGRLQVVTLGLDNILRFWDGLLQKDFVDERMQARDEEYCTFREITASVMTWNAGASKPTWLRSGSDDGEFFRKYLTASDGPDILVFGFQELVDLEDKKLTAKSFFKSSKKKDPSDHESMSHQYRAWLDHLVRSLDQFMPRDSAYTLLQTANMVGLFTCVFVRASLRSSIKSFHNAEVKRGMGGLHGNKGAIILRLLIDDSSICLVNCHLAAGQTQTMHRNADIAGIMDSENLPTLPGSEDSFVRGGDGAMIGDHEICLVSGDLNYRIDAMTRDGATRAVRDGNLAKLLERDQLLLSRRRHPGFKLKLFQEMPIAFAPTYKYNVGSDDYDTSEKKRSPAWCDRILFRGLGRVKCVEYRRWEVRVSDHRPVSGKFRMRIKTIDAARREKVLGKVRAEYEGFSREVRRFLVV